MDLPIIILNLVHKELTKIFIKLIGVRFVQEIIFVLMKGCNVLCCVRKGLYVTPKSWFSLRNCALKEIIVDMELFQNERILHVFKKNIKIHILNIVVEEISYLKWKIPKITWIKYHYLSTRKKKFVAETTEYNIIFEWYESLWWLSFLSPKIL